MKYTIKISDDAYWDLADAIRYYRSVSSDELANRFRDSFKSSLVRIVENPENFRIRYKNIRSINLKIFPYQIHFYILEKIIFVVGVFHSKSNPKNWSKRL